eukprot:466842-Rhodomonas_salina.1
MMRLRRCTASGMRPFEHEWAGRIVGAGEESAGSRSSRGELSGSSFYLHPEIRNKKTHSSNKLYSGYVFLYLIWPCSASGQFTAPPASALTPSGGMEGGRGGGGGQEGHNGTRDGERSLRSEPLRASKILKMSSPGATTEIFSKRRKICTA